MSSSTPWYNRKFLVIILVIAFFPVGLYGLWKSTAFSKKAKTVWTAGILAVVIISNVNYQSPPSTPKPQITLPQSTPADDKITVDLAGKNQKQKRSNNPDHPEALDVNIKVSTQMKSGKFYIHGKTNLPDKTQLMISLLRGKNYSAQDKAIVSNGSFSSQGFTHKNSPLRNGNYTIRISTPISRVQPGSVKNQIGEHGEYLTGLLVSKDSDVFPDDYFVNFKSHLTIKNSVDAHDDTPQLLAYLEKFEAHYAKLKDVMKTNTLSGVWSGQWNRELKAMGDEFDKKFGRNIGEYKGECSQGFFNISVGAGYMYNVWSEYNALNSGRGKIQILNDMKKYVAEHFKKAHDEIDTYQKNKN